MKIGKLIGVGFRWALLQLPLAFALMIIKNFFLATGGVIVGGKISIFGYLTLIFLSLFYNGWLLTKFNGWLLGRTKFNYGTKRGRR